MHADSFTISPNYQNRLMKIIFFLMNINPCQENTISKDKRFLYLDVKDAVGVNLDAGCLLEELCQLVLVVLLNLHHFSKELLYHELRITSTDYFVRRSVRPSSPIVPWSTLCSALSKRF